MKDADFERLAKQAFAVAVQKAFPDADPKAEEVKLTPGKSPRQYLCEWDAGDLSISGQFSRWFFHSARSGVVHLDLAQYLDIPFWESLFADQHYFADIPKAYDEHQRRSALMLPSSV